MVVNQRQFVQSLSRGFNVLAKVCESEAALSLSELAKESDLSIGAIQRLTYTLEKMGLVERKQDLRDRRRVLVEITPAGREVVGQVRRFRIARLHKTLAHLSPEDASDLLRLLKLYLEAFREQLERDPGS